MAQQKGLSTNTKLIIGFCVGCLVLVTLFFIGTALFGGLFFKNVVGPSIEKSLQEPLEDSEFYFDEEKQEFGVTDEEDNTSFKTGTQIPDSFPNDIPLYPNAEVNQSIEVGNAFQVALQSGDDVNKVVTYYKTEMEKNEWVQEASFSFEEGHTISFSKGENRNAVIAISREESEKVTLISITYEEKE